MDAAFLSEERRNEEAVNNLNGMRCNLDEKIEIIRYQFWEAIFVLALKNCFDGGFVHSDSVRFEKFSHLGCREGNQVCKLISN